MITFNRPGNAKDKDLLVHPRAVKFPKQPKVFILLNQQRISFIWQDTQCTQCNLENPNKLLSFSNSMVIKVSIYMTCHCHHMTQTITPQNLLTQWGKYPGDIKSGNMNSQLSKLIKSSFCETCLIWSWVYIRERHAPEFSPPQQLGIFARKYYFDIEKKWSFNYVQFSVSNINFISFQRREEGRGKAKII